MAKKKASVVNGPLPHLEAGYYRLTQDVENPHPDKRSRQMMNLPVWEKGIVVQVRYSRSWKELLEKMGVTKMPNCGTIHFSDNSMIHFDENSDESLYCHGNCLLPFLEVEPEKLGQILRDPCGYSAGELLALAMEENCIDLEWIKAHNTRRNEEPEDQDSAIGLRQRHWL